MILEEYNPCVEQYSTNGTMLDAVMYNITTKEAFEMTHTIPRR